MDAKIQICVCLIKAHLLKMEEIAQHFAQSIVDLSKYNALVE